MAIGDIAMARGVCALVIIILSLLLHNNAVIRGTETYRKKKLYVEHETYRKKKLYVEHKIFEIFGKGSLLRMRDSNKIHRGGL